MVLLLVTSVVTDAELLAALEPASVMEYKLMV
jgi:hypothetical protein